MPRSIYARDKVVSLAGSLWERADRAWDRNHFDEAERLFKLAAEMGHHVSMNSLGKLFEDLGRSRESLHWYKRAVAAGSGMAAWNLAMNHVPSGQKRWYWYWIRKAAALGYKDALIEIAKFARRDCKKLS